MKKLQLILFALVLSACTAPKTGGSIQQVKSTAPTMDKQLPVDPKVRIGKLDNGIKYYIRVNSKPEKRAELRLVVNAGSILEDDDQQGLAHLVEHMGFNGTRHFPKQELVDYLESIGTKFGPDLNAYTSFDKTVYMLKVPTDSLELTEKGFLVLEDWAHGMNLDDEEIDKERGVVIEEWRLGRGAEMRMLDKQLPVLFKDSRYATRLPIGKKAVLDSFHVDAPKRFYSDWYRPDLMAVIAVGDFDPDWIENVIKDHFSGIPPKKNPRIRKVFDVPDHEETLFAIAADPEATRTSVQILYKQDVQPERTFGDYRREIIEGLYNSMLSQRLNELTKKPDAPFLYGFSYQGSFWARSKNTYLLGAGVTEDGVQEGLEALMIEAERVTRFGFTESELVRSKKEVLRGMESAYEERDKTDSRRYTRDYINNFLEDHPIPGIEVELELYKQFLPTIQLAEVNTIAQSWITDRNRVIAIDGPEKEGLEIPSKSEMMAVFDAVKKLDITPYEDAVLDKPLIEFIPVPSTVMAENQIEELGTTEWTLANGVRVFLKPTDFKNDEVLFSARSPGGSSLVDDNKYVAAMTASRIIREAGIGQFNQIELDKMLAGKIARVNPYIGTLEEGFNGSASPQDLETMFQLIHLYFSAPRLDSSAFLAYKERMNGFLENRSSRPETAFRDTIQVTMAQNHLRSRPWSTELLTEMDLGASFEIYTNRFANAGDFTFYFVGNFSLDSIKPLVELYLGGLPDTGREEQWKDVGIEPPQNVVEKHVKKGLEQKSLSNIIFTGPFEWSGKNRYHLKSMVQALRIKLREVMREDLSGTYFVSVRGNTTHFPKERYRIDISFGGDPGRIEELTEAAFQQIDSIKTVGTTDKYLTKVKETQRRERETDLKENRFWLKSLSFYDFHHEDPLNLLKYNEAIDELTLEDIQSAANVYLNTSNYVQVTLYPEDFGVNE